TGRHSRRRSERVECAVDRSGRREVAGGAAPFAAVEIRAGSTRSIEIVFRVGARACQKTGVQHLHLVDMRGGEREDMGVAEKLILHVLGDISESIGRSLKSRRRSR